MRILLLLLIIAGTCRCNCSAQKIHFTDLGNKWFVNVIDNNGFHRERYFIGRDTFLSGKNYKILNNQNIGLREDTISRRVYWRDVGGGFPIIDSTEYLLYRYDLQLGDTVRYRNYTDSVIGIDSVLINNVYHKAFKLRDAGFTVNFHKMTIIEGVGCLQGPFYPQYGICGEAESRMVCFRHDGIYPSVNYAYSNCAANYTFTNPGTCADSFALDVPQVFHGILSAGIFPNPYTTASVIRFSQTVSDGLLLIYDAMGRSIYRQAFAAKREWPVGSLHLQPGIYYYQIADRQQGTAAKGKFSVLQ